MCSEPLAKEFEKTTEVLPFTKYGLSTAKDFRNEEARIHQLEALKRAGLSDEEIKLYEENEAGHIEELQKIEQSVLKSKLQNIYSKINKFSAAGCSKQSNAKPSSDKSENISARIEKKPLNFYPEGHPMNDLKEIEESLFSHLKNDNIIPVIKRRKMLRRLERKKQRILSQQNHFNIGILENVPVSRPGSLWDLREIPVRVRSQRQIGPKKQTMYTIKDNKIVRLEPVNAEERPEEYRAVDIVMPVNPAEEQLLEGTKMSLDDIKKIDRFKDYEPGMPSKVLYLKNIAPSVSQEQLSLLFNQFVLDNGGPIDVRLLSGRMRGQAFVTFAEEDIAIRALDEVNGTILSGRPVIALFGRHGNQFDEHR